MNRKQIRVGQVYAWSRERLDARGIQTRPVLILDLNADFPSYDTYWRVTDTRKGILGVFVDPLTLADPGEEKYRRSTSGNLSYGGHGVGTLGEVKPANLWRGWLAQVEIDAHDEDYIRDAKAAADAQEAIEQKRIDEFYALVPPAARPDHPIRPGMAPFITVEELITIVKTARTEALAEVGGTGGRCER